MYLASRQYDQDFGDGVKQLKFRIALRAIISLGGFRYSHPKNWVPSPLILCRPWGLLPEKVIVHPKLIAFAKYFKRRGLGLFIAASVLEGEYNDNAIEAKYHQDALQRHINSRKAEGLAQVIVAKSIHDGVVSLIQTTGLGSLKPNMVVFRSVD